MTTVIALGGNALLRRGEPFTIAGQQDNIRRALEAVVPLVGAEPLVLTHGNGPQVGWLAARDSAEDGLAMPLDILGAETEGLIGYLIARELGNALQGNRDCVTVLTQVEIDPDDPAFARPEKPIGPVYAEADALRIARERGWKVARDGIGYRRVVASPAPRRIVELPAIRRLIAGGIVVVCAGGGGIPVACGADGRYLGVDAVVDKDRASAVLAEALEAHRLLMLTDVPAVIEGWETPSARAIRRVACGVIDGRRFAPGSMGPKVEAAVAFASATGGTAHIGALADAAAILRGEAGTEICPGPGETLYWP